MRPTANGSQYGGISMTTWIFRVVVGAFVILTTSAVYAQGVIYRWTDAKGTLSFGQAPPRNRPYHTLTPMSASAPPPVSASQPGETAVNEEPQSLNLPLSLDVTGDSLSGQTFAGWDWDDALLNRVVLNGANLSGTSFRGASLIEATF